MADDNLTGPALRRPGLRPLAHQLGNGRVLCLPGCISDTEAQALADAGGHVGDVHPWTVDLYAGDDDLRCDGCGRVLVHAPRWEPEPGDGPDVEPGPG
ncbi:hypothetical protein ACIBEJ_00790 [Nonomuraea sp. NPDC050790]|uniref:hypothetical protein n=1 Tax=Nonomuraea sp. NPDC050790 TaxID=3364371 RepID=UPI00379D5E19